MLKVELSQMVTLSTMVSSLTLFSRPTPMLRLLDKLLLMLKKKLIPGEMDGLTTPVQLPTHMDLFNTEPTQMDIPLTTVSSLIPSLRPTLMPKPPEPPLCLLKKNPMHGELDSLQTLDQSLITYKDKTQMMPIPMLPPSVNWKVNLRKSQTNIMLEFFGETNKKKKQMPGEVLHGLQPTLILALKLFKETLSQMDTLSTMVSSLILSKILTKQLRQKELQVLLLKKKPMNGELEVLQTLDQLLFMPKIQLITTLIPPTWTHERPDLNLGKTITTRKETGEYPSKREWTPGELFHTLPRTLIGKVLPPLHKDNQDQTQPTMDLLTKH